MNHKKAKNYSIIGFIIVFILTFIVIEIITNVEVKDDIDEPIVVEKYYNIKIDKPVVGIELLDKKIDQIILQSKNDIITESNESKKFLKEIGLQYELVIQYEKYEIENQDVKTLILKKYYYTGGAHYNSEIYTFHYDDEKEIEFSSLFKTDVEYLERLSKLSYDVLMQEKEKDENFVLFGDEEVKLALEPKKENFENCYFTKEGINIIFPVYQVAPYIMGDVKIVIPYKAIRDILSIDIDFGILNEKQLFREERDLTLYKDKKLVAFTFDDGPSNHNTLKLLDELKLRDAKVSFFLVGSRVPSQKHVIERMYEEGHTIGSHTYNHKNLNYLSEYETEKEIVDTNQAIYDIIGEYPKFLRPPYGNKNSYIQKSFSNPIILWSVDTEDWKNKDADVVKKNILKDVKDGSIVLLHDLYETFVEGALAAMDELKKQGYAFVSIEEMFKIKEIEIDNNSNTYFYFYTKNK